MDRRERTNDLGIAAIAMLEGWQSELWTALPAQIESFDPAKKTATLQPLIQAQVQQQDGSYKWETGPLLVDVPVYFPRGGNYALTFPVSAGDEALVVFASRCIDSWWQQGGVQPQMELRMHDLSDGFAYVGFSSVPNVESGISTTTTQLRALDGSHYVEVGSGQIKLVHPTKVLVDSPLTEFTGDGQIDGNLLVKQLISGQNGMSVSAGTNGSSVDGGFSVTNGGVAVTGGDVTADGISLKTHVHGGVTTGTGTTEAPQ